MFYMKVTAIVLKTQLQVSFKKWDKALKPLLRALGSWYKYLPNFNSIAVSAFET